MLLLVFKEAYVRKTLRISAKNVEWLSSYSIISLKISSELSASKWTRLAKTSKITIRHHNFRSCEDIQFKFSGLFKSLNSVRERIWKRFEDREVKTFQKNCYFDMEWPITVPLKERRFLTGI